MAGLDPWPAPAVHVSAKAWMPSTAPDCSPSPSPHRRTPARPLAEFLRHLRHAVFDSTVSLRQRAEPAFRIVQRRRVVAHVLGDLHRAELRPAHRAEVRDLGASLRQRLVVVLARGLRIEREVELVLPAELEARLRQRVVRTARAGWPLARSAACAAIL